MKELYELEKSTKQAHAQYQIKEQTDTFNEQEILNQIASLRIKHPMLGLKKLFHKVKPTNIGRDRFIAMAMASNLGIEKPKNYRRTTYSTKSNRYKNLLGGLCFDDINQLWVSDISYFWVLDRFFYIVLIMDVYSRQIVGHHASASLLASANVAALKVALKTRTKQDLSALIHHRAGGPVRQGYAIRFQRICTTLRG